MASEPTPTLAEMVERLRGEIEEIESAHEIARVMPGFEARAVDLARRAQDHRRLSSALTEIDRRLTALEGRQVAVHVGQGVTPIAGGLAYLGALPGVACVSPAGPVKVVRLDSTPAHLPTCGTAFRGCDPACPKDRAERGI